MSDVLVTGASGFVGAAIARVLAAAGHAVRGTYGAHAERVPEGVEPIALDLVPPTGETVAGASLEAAFRTCWPEVVVHAAALADLRACEVDPARARAVNVEASAKLARLAAAIGARFLFLSTDQVFDGDRGGYGEDDPPNPLHEYGRSKLEAERAVLREHGSATVLRLALVHGESPSGERSASEQVVQLLRSGQRPRLFVDEFRSPIHVDDVAGAVAELLFDRDVRLLHLGGPRRLSRHELGVEVARAAGLDPAAIEPVRLADLDLVPRRPRDVSFDVRRARERLVRPPRS